MAASLGSGRRSRYLRDIVTDEQQTMSTGIRPASFTTEDPSQKGFEPLYYRISIFIIKISIPLKPPFASIISTNKPTEIHIMKKQSNHEADIRNANKGTPGTNQTYDKNQGNRGWQLNPENPANTGSKK